MPALRKDPELFKTTARNEYMRRGEPAKSTRWTCDEICLFMKHRLSKLEPHADIGVFAHKLPRATGITPAPFPPSVLEWEKQQKKSAAKRQAPPPPPEAERTSKRGRPETETPATHSVPRIIPAEGYKTKFDQTKKKWMLCHDDIHHQIPLETASKSKPKIYADPAGNDVVWGGGELEPHFCQTLFEDFRASQQKSLKSSMRDIRAAPVKAMRGMAPTAFAAPSFDDPKEDDQRVPVRGPSTNDWVGQQLGKHGPQIAKHNYWGKNAVSVSRIESKLLITGY